MRVCSICGERNEDWMEICQRCGNSITNADVEEYKAKSNNKEYKYSYDQNDENYLNDKPKKEKTPIVIENFDLKIVIIILLIVLIALIGYTIYVIS